LTGTGKTLKIWIKVKIILTIRTLLLGPLMRRLRSNGIIVGSPLESVLTLIFKGSDLVGFPANAWTTSRKHSFRYLKECVQPLYFTRVVILVISNRTETL